MTRPLAVVLLLCALAGCSAVMTPAEGSDYDGDGTVTFRDAERTPRPSVEYGGDPPDVDEALRRHMDRQRDDYRERVREGETFDY